MCVLYVTMCKYVSTMCTIFWLVICVVHHVITVLNVLRITSRYSSVVDIWLMLLLVVIITLTVAHRIVRQLVMQFMLLNRWGDVGWP